MRPDSTNTFLTVTSLAMFSVTSVLVGLLVCNPDASGATECDPNSLEIQCDEGKFCNEFGFCADYGPPVDEGPLPACAAGQTIDGCECRAPLLDRDGKCEAPPPDAICQHPEVANLLARLDRHCTEDSTLVGDLSNCEPAALRSVVIDNLDLIASIAHGFREQSLTLHFDVGLPRKGDATRWPGRNARVELSQHLASSLTDIEPRGYLLIVSFASPDGDETFNFELAKRRSDAAVGLMSQARNAFVALETTLAPITTIVGVVGETRALKLAEFDAIWGSAGKFRGWDAAATERMTRDLAAWRAGELPARELAWLTRTVQQSVLVLPLPCEPATAKAHG